VNNQFKSAAKSMNNCLRGMLEFFEVIRFAANVAAGGVVR
jgi:hypothetical protein